MNSKVAMTVKEEMSVDVDAAASVTARHGKHMHGLGAGVLWSGLLLLALWMVMVGGGPAGYSVPTVKAAPLPATTQLSTIAFSQATYLFSEGVGSGAIALLISPPSSTPVTVTVFSNSIQAEPDLDFEGLRDRLVIPPSAAAYTLSLDILDDTWVEGEEQLLLTFDSLDGIEPGVITETLVTIADNDVAYLSVSDVTVDEEAESVTLIITQSVTSTLQTLIDVRTLPDSATAPDDFSAIFTTALIPPDSTETSVTIPLHGDDEVEGDERFIMQLEDATNAQFANGQATLTATVTLIDDDILPEVEITPPSASESARVLPFVATLSTTWPQTVTVDYATRDGSAVAPDDYVATTGRFTIPPGTLSTTVLVPINEDDRRESDENLFLVLSNPVQAMLSNTEIEGIIEDANTSSTLYLPGLAR